MVARGDMGVELPEEEVPIIQKMIIKKVYEAGKQVITATQMLDSMMQKQQTLPMLFMMVQVPLCYQEKQQQVNIQLKQFRQCQELLREQKWILTIREDF